MHRDAFFLFYFILLRNEDLIALDAYLRPEGESKLCVVINI